MRRSALALLVTSTGCNWVYGLTATVAVDAGPDSPDAPDAPPDITSRLVWGIVTTDGVGNPDAEIILAGIGSEAVRPDEPTIQIGPEVGVGPLMQIGYGPADGRFEIPYTLREAPHRIVYTMPGESLQHEVQWSISGATLVIPRLTRKDAPVPPAGSGYHVVPTGIADITFPGFITIGAFAYDDRDASFTRALNDVTYNYQQHAQPLAGPVGAPETAHGDWQLLVAWAARSAYTRTLEGFCKVSLDLMPGGATSPATQPAFIRTERTLSTGMCPGTNCFPTVPISSTEQRITNVLGTLAGASFKYRQAYGVSPSLKSPAFVPGPAPDFVGRPVMFPFQQSTNIDATIQLVDPSLEAPAEVPLERVFYAHIGTTRVVGGAPLLSYVQVMTNTFNGAAPAARFGAPLVENVKLGNTSLSGAADDVAHPASSQPADLTFSSESASAVVASADDYVVTLYEITGGALSPVRVYHVITPLVKVDSSLLVSGHTYVFGITSRVGIPGAKNGTYEAVTYPFSESTTFARSFTIQ
jgi:hypothetical protein